MSDQNHKGEREYGNYEVIGVVLVALAIFGLFCLIWPVSDVFQFVKDFLVGVFGVTAFAVCIVMAIIGIALIRRAKVTVKASKIFFSTILVISALTILHIYNTSSLINSSDSIGAYLGTIYSTPVTVGGVVFGLLAYGSVKLCTLIGAYVVFGLIMVAMLLLVCDIRAVAKNLSVRKSNAPKVKKNKKQIAQSNGLVMAEIIPTKEQLGMINKTKSYKPNKNGVRKIYPLNSDETIDKEESNSSGDSQNFANTSYMTPNSNIDDKQSAHASLYAPMEPAKKEQTKEDIEQKLKTEFVMPPKFVHSKTKPIAQEQDIKPPRIIDGEQRSQELARQRKQIENIQLEQVQEDVEQVDKPVEPTIPFVPPRIIDGDKLSAQRRQQKASVEQAKQEAKPKNDNFITKPAGIVWKNSLVNSIQNSEKSTEQPTKINNIAEQSNNTKSNSNNGQTNNFKSIWTDKYYGDNDQTKSRWQRVINQGVQAIDEFNGNSYNKENSFVFKPTFSDNIKEDLELSSTEEKLDVQQSQTDNIQNEELVDNAINNADQNSYNDYPKDNQQNILNSSTEDNNNDYNSELSEDNQSNYDNESEEIDSNDSIEQSKDDILFTTEQEYHSQDNSDLMEPKELDESEEIDDSEQIDDSDDSFSVEEWNQDIENLDNQITGNVSNHTPPYDPQSYSEQSIKQSKNSQEQEEEQEEVEEEQENVFQCTDHYVYPTTDLLDDSSTFTGEVTEECHKQAEMLEQTLEEFDVRAKVIAISKGPAVTRYELEMEKGTPVNKVRNCADDIAYALASRSGVRIETPIPGKKAVGVEVPNDKIDIVSLKDIIESPEFQNAKSPLTFALGKDISGKVMLGDIEKMPHLLVAGATGSGKSSCLNSLITSLIYRSSPSELRLMLVDPKRVEFVNYDGIPHLLLPKALNTSVEALNAMEWLIKETTRRLEIFMRLRVRKIKEYNNHPDVLNGKIPKLPYIVMIVDELADLMTYNKKELEDKIVVIAQKSRAAGIHLVLATQRPSVDVITGIIKANLPSRIAFSVASQVDSRTIIEQVGAEKLLGRGDMLYAPIELPDAVRIQGCYVDGPEVTRVADFIKQYNHGYFNKKLEQEIHKDPNEEQAKDEESVDENENEFMVDVYAPKALKFFIETGRVSASALQRRLGLGFNRAAKIVDYFEMCKFIGPMTTGSHNRQVLIGREKFEEIYGDWDSVTTFK